METIITLKNAITDARQQVSISPGQTVRQAVEDSGFIAAGSAFAVRDKNGHIVDNDQAATHANTLLTVGLPGDRVSGGAGAARLSS